MGTVLSFSPRERRPIYTTHHHGSGTISTSSSTDFTLNNYTYNEQLNNVKNRENTKPMNLQTLPNLNHNSSNSNLVMFGSSNNHANIININNNNNMGSNTTIQDRQADSARILSEKNALEKNLKKHSLFINALSWKRLAASHGKKKMESNGKNKSGNFTTNSFRPAALTDTVHPIVVVDKNKNYQTHQIQLSSSNSNLANNNLNNQQQTQQQQPTVYFTPGGPKTLLALDLVRAANNANTLQQQQNIEKNPSKLPIQIPVQPTNFHSQQQQLHHTQIPQQNSHHGPRKTVIQVSAFIIINWKLMYVIFFFCKVDFSLSLSWWIFLPWHHFLSFYCYPSFCWNLRILL